MVAQAWRDGGRQTTLARLLGSPLCEVLALDDRQARAAGQICGVAKTSDVVDASVAVAAARSWGQSTHLRSGRPATPRSPHRCRCHMSSGNSGGGQGAPPGSAKSSETVVTPTASGTLTAGGENLLGTTMRGISVPCPFSGPGKIWAPPAGLEPAPPAPEAGALSAELRGRVLQR